MNASQMEPKSVPTPRRVLVGVWKNLPSENAVTLFSDATTDKDDLESLLGKSVIDITPTGHVARAKRIVQYPLDITRQTAPNRFQAILRGVLTDFGKARRVGVITHRTLATHAKKLGEPYSSRVVKVAYFGSGSDRASNDWHDQCDLVIIAGTPRVPGDEVQSRLIQFGDFASAGEDGRWGAAHWRGRTESGQEVIVPGRGYSHPGWERAHRSLVRAAIIQAAGRGRTLLESGCDVAVLSTEECSFPLADNCDISLTETEACLLTVLTELSPVVHYMPTKEQPAMRSPATTAELARRMRLSVSQMRDILTGLESRRLVSRVGERGGWLPTAE